MLLQTQMIEDREYLQQKIQALQAAEEKGSNYLDALNSLKNELKTMATEARIQAETEQNKRKLERTEKGIKWLPFYQFDSAEGQSSWGLELMKEIAGGRRKRNKNRRIEVDDLMSNVSTSSSEESLEFSSNPRATKKEGPLPELDSEDFENFDSYSEEGVLGKRINKEERQHNLSIEEINEKQSSIKGTHSSNDESQNRSLYEFRKASKKFERQELVSENSEKKEKYKAHTQLLNNIIMEYGMTPENIQKFNLVEIAAKKNTVKNLQEVGLPIFGNQIYRQLKVWNRLPPSEVFNAQSVTWTPEEDARLTQLVSLLSNRKWKQISLYMDGKKPSQCYHRWFRVLCPKRVVTKWEDPIDDALLGLGALVYQRPSGKYKWVKISELFDGRRTDIQCRERFMNILEPNIKSGLANENAELAKNLYEKIGPKWSKIAKVVAGTTDNQIKRIVEKDILKNSTEISQTRSRYKRSSKKSETK